MASKNFLNNWFLILLCFFPSVSQASLIKHFNSGNGLGNDHVKGLAYDHLGYLWIGTESGLKRFDGAEFRNFNLSDVIPGFNDENRIVDLFPAKDGSVLGIGISGIVFRAIGDTITKSRLPKEFFGNFQSCGTNDNAEYMYHYTREGRIYGKQHLRVNEQMLDFYSPNCQLVTSIRLPDNKSSKLLNRLFNIGLNELFFLDEHLRTRRLDGNRWSKPEKIKGLPDFKNLNLDNVYILKTHFFDSSVVLIIESHIYFLKFNTSSGSFEVELQDHSIQTTDINFVVWSKDLSTLCIGTRSDGLYVIYNIASLSKEKIYKSGSETGVFLIDDSTLITSTHYLIQNETLSKISGIPSDRISRSFCKDKHGRTICFVGSDQNYLLRVSPGKRIHYEKIPIDAKESPNCLYMDPDERIWIYYPNNGLSIYRILENNQINLIKNFPEIKWVKQAILEDEVMLAFSDLNLCYYLNIRTLQYRTLPLPKNLARIRNVHQVSKDTFLLVTYGNGPYIYASGITKKIPLDRFSSLQYAHSIDLIKNHYFISTNSGLVIFSKENLLNHLYIGSPIYYKNINSFHYFKNEFNGECAPCSQVSGNKIYYSHIEGIAEIEAEHYLEIENQTHGFHADSLSFGLGPFSAFPNRGSLIQMSENQNIIRIKTSAIYWGDRNNLSIRVTVVNSDFILDTIFYHNTIILENLPSGNNFIELTLLNEGVPVELYEFILNKQEAYYEKWAFWVLLISASLSLVFFGFYVYNQILRARNRVLKLKVKRATSSLETLLEKISKDKDEIEQTALFKNKIISIITHDVLGPLNMTNLLLHQMELSTDNQTQKMQLTEIQKSNENLTRQAFEILTWSKLQNNALKPVMEQFNLFDLIHDLLMKYQIRSNTKNLQVVNEICNPTIVHSDKSIIGIAISNILENAIKYGEKELRLQHYIYKNHCIISVKNYGKGFKSEYVQYFNQGELDKAIDYVSNPQKGGYGLRICREILRALNGQIKISSRPGGITAVRIVIEFKPEP